MSSVLHLAALLLVVILAAVDSFTPGSKTNSNKRATILSAARGPSKISDPAGPTIEAEPLILPEVDIDSLPESHFDKDDIPIPGQPWRRGLTAGCEDPIDSEWRKKAEKMIKLGVEMSNGTYIDTTWFLTSVMVTIGIDFQSHPRDMLREETPEVIVDAGTSGPLWGDPDDPFPDDIDFEADKTKAFFERDYLNEEAIANRTYAKPDEDEGEDDSPESLGLDPNEEPPLYVDKEFREDLAVRQTVLRTIRESKTHDDRDYLDMFWGSRKEYMLPEQMPYVGEKINTAALSNIGAGILECLKEVEDECQVLSRHEVVMTTPGDPRAVDTQKQFDAAIGKRVTVHTSDPWGSNRKLYGILVDRNTLDVYINQKGRLVTIPNCFVGGVELMLTEEEEEEILLSEMAKIPPEGISERQIHADGLRKGLELLKAELEYSKQIEQDLKEEEEELEAEQKELEEEEGDEDDIEEEDSLW